MKAVGAAAGSSSTAKPPFCLRACQRRTLRRQQLGLPRVRADGVAEDGLVVAAGEPVRRRGLLVRPAGRKGGGGGELGVHDRAVAHRRADDPVATLAQGAEQRIEFRGSQRDSLGRGLCWHGPPSALEHSTVDAQRHRWPAGSRCGFSAWTRGSADVTARAGSSRLVRERCFGGASPPTGARSRAGRRVPALRPPARAARTGLAGFVLNDGEGVVIEAEGPSTALDAFAAARRRRGTGPRACELARGRTDPAARRAWSSRSGSAKAPPCPRRAVIPPDTATCEDCLRELFDPADRRYRYPFLNCTQCGPRLTIVRSVPYDRARTTMASFELCADCRREYEDPGDRRFHAEPIACPVCGPQLSLPLADAVACLRAGGILAVKGLGGYHLACDARDEDAVARLRGRKHREEKPLAVMTGDPDALCRVEPEERVLLESPARPIVLMRRLPGCTGRGTRSHPARPGSACCSRTRRCTICSGTTCSCPFVLTSGNLSDEPIAFDDDGSAAAARRHRRRVPRQRPPDPPPLRGLRRPAAAPCCAAPAATRRRRCRSRSPRPFRSSPRAAS